MSIEKKINLTAGLILLTFFAQFFITKELWIPNEREFPMIPFFDFLPIQFNKTIDLILIILMFTSFLFLLWKSDQKKYLLLFVLPGLLLILEDNIRLQPWFYLHFIMIGIILLENKIEKINVYRLLQWVVIAIYFWSGFNKLNIAFAWEIFPWFTQPLGIEDYYFQGMDNLNSYPLPSQNKIAFIIPAIEIITAFLLLIPKTRLFGIISVLIIHLFSLWMVGPWGHNWNQIIWPWNLEMPILVYLLFSRPLQLNIKPYVTEQFQILKTKTGIFIFGLLFLFPFIGFFGFWHKGLSLHLYSGNSDEIEFYFDGYEENLAHTSMSTHLYLDTTNLKSAMRVEYWAIEQTGVPMYNSISYFKKIGKHLCGCLENQDKAGIKIFRRSGFYSNQNTLDIPCKELN